MTTRGYMVRCEIDAPTDVVWRILADVESWPRWTPTMTSIRRVDESSIGEGSKFLVKQPGFPPAKFVVDTWNEGTSFSWSSSTVGVRTVADHVLAHIGHGQTELTLLLESSGPLSRWVWLLAGTKFRRYVDTEAESLKSAAERNVGGAQ